MGERTKTITTILLALVGLILLAWGSVGVVSSLGKVMSTPTPNEGDLVVLEGPVDVSQAASASNAPVNLGPDGTPSVTPTSGTPIGESATLTPSVTPGPGLPPDRIEIPVIGLDAPVIPAQMRKVQLGEVAYGQWVAPDERAAGWHPTSAGLGQPGNTVINGHHNVYGKVFGGLINLRSGDLIQVFSGQTEFDYVVTNTMILPERFVNDETRLDNARWILPSDDERLTLITCWPETSNTHRLIVVARPISPDAVKLLINSRLR